MDFQDFIIEFCQDYAVVGLALFLAVSSYLYAASRKKGQAKQFGFEKTTLETGKSGENRFLKREAVNDQMSQVVEQDQMSQGDEKNKITNDFDDGDNADESVTEDDEFTESESDERESLEHGYGLLTDDGDDIDDYDQSAEEYQDEMDDGEYGESSEQSDYLNKKSKVQTETKPVNQGNLKEKEQALGVLVMYLVPSNAESFLGYELLQALSNYSVHLSEKKHFQRFSNDNGSGQLWYHVASMTNPGTFDMTEPGKLECRGLVFIMEPAKVEDLSTAYESMLKTCNGLSEELDAELLDEDQQKFTENKARQMRYQIARKTIETCSG